MKAKEPIRKAATFRLPAGVLTALAKRAQKERVSRTVIVEAALREHLGVSSYLQRHAPQRGGRRVPPA